MGTYSCESEDQISALQELRKRFWEKLAKTKKLDEKLLELLPRKDSVKELEDIPKHKDWNSKIIRKIDWCLSEAPPGILNLLSISNRTPLVSQDAKVKLPKLELPKFDGDMMNCREFWDQSQITIHDNENIAEIDKFTYLKSFLSNSALLAISGLTKFGQFKDAIDILQQHYGNTQVLISVHMTKFTQLQIFLWSKRTAKYVWSSWK